MREELVSFVLHHDLSPFESTKTIVKSSTPSIYQTKDAKAVHTKVLNQVSKAFTFKETTNLWNLFDFTTSFEDIKKRQTFFSNLKPKNNTFLSQLHKPRPTWKPQYDITVVTEEESTFVQLKELGCNVQLLVSENDVLDLERYDIVQVIDCPTYQLLLERLPQSVFIDSQENVYLERYLETLSGWKENLIVLNDVKEELSQELRLLLGKLEPLFDLLTNKANKILNEAEVEKIVEDINERVSEKIKELTISGEGLMNMLGEGKMPPALLEIVREEITASGLSEHLFNAQLPVTIDYQELEEQIKRQSANEFTSQAQDIKRHANALKEIPTILSYLSADLLVEDFCLGVGAWIGQGEGKRFPGQTQELLMIDAYNMFLAKPQPVSFKLDHEHKCSILTGANSGGKTTLIEHVIQSISLQQLGLPLKGEFSAPLFTDVYYFAKNKGSASKGAFETLLTQMAQIKPTDKGGKTLILADEIEAVTEPGVAGKIIAATAEYFIDKKCLMILATHLGHEIQKNLPIGARIDGIEATGLDKEFNLIVNHNPVLGKLAHSTPELIIERMANAHKKEYFSYLNDYTKKKA